MKLLEVLTGREKLYVHVDSDTYRWAKNYTWRINKDGYVARRSHGKEYLLHRVVNDTPPGKHTDHINRNKLDNRRRNLRSCTHQSNQANAKLNSRNVSGYKGVTPFHNKWKAGIFYGQKTHYLGIYDTALEAALQFDHVAVQLDPLYATNKALGLL